MSFFNISIQATVKDFFDYDFARRLLKYLEGHEQGINKVDDDFIALYKSFKSLLSYASEEGCVVKIR